MIPYVTEGGAGCYQCQPSHNAGLQEVIVSVKTTILQFNSDVWLFSSSSVAPQAVFVTTGVTVGFTV